MGETWSYLMSPSPELTRKILPISEPVQEDQLFTIVFLECKDWGRLLASIQPLHAEIQKQIALAHFGFNRPISVRKGVDWKAVDVCFRTHADAYEFRVDHKTFARRGAKPQFKTEM